MYNAMYFKRFFKMPIGLFDSIVEDITEHDDYFRQKEDALHIAGLDLLLFKRFVLPSDS